jgi:SpoVK/Ycf46/Vps4 family AAA+-type ATPase
LYLVQFPEPTSACHVLKTIVMLHALEYFKGIVIMTTNRVMTFDVAMLSRCHYAITFKKLSLEQERLIWKGYMGQLDDNTCSLKERQDLETWIDEMTSEDRPKNIQRLNGREIRNVFTTAQTLAQGEAVDKRITSKHVKSAYNRTTDFLQSMWDRVNRGEKNLYAE